MIGSFLSTNAWILLIMIFAWILLLWRLDKLFARAKARLEWTFGGKV